MLTNLSIKNILLIDKLNIEFGKSLTVLTGETGAGKSILLDALLFALGGNFNEKIIRSGEKSGEVVVEFHFESKPKISEILYEYGIDFEQDLFIRRAIYEDGKNKIFINDTPCSKTILKKISAYLVEIQGQHDQGSLLDNKNHIDFLDSFGGYKDLLNLVKQLYDEYCTINKEIEVIQQSIDKNKSEKEYLNHIASEIRNFAPKEGEAEHLANKKIDLQNLQKISSVINMAISSIENGKVEENIYGAERILSRNNNFQNLNFDRAIELLIAAANNIDEANSILRSKIADFIENQDQSIDYIEDRLYELKTLERKTGISSDKFIDYLNEVEEKLKSIDLADNHLTELNKKQNIIFEEYRKLANILENERINTAKKAEDLIHKELAQLKMQSTIFKIQITRVEEDYIGPKGFNKVIFMASTNPGMPLDQISKIASGGELSRFMLALKVIMSSSLSNTTIIFDEIDTGIGGAVADSVGKRLAKLAEHEQIIAITHQPQVAARAEHHLKVSKETIGNQTFTIVKKLSEAEKIEEIARMLSGEDITDQAKKLAKELIS